MMSLARPATPEGQAGLDALLADPRHALVAADFDGTLAPIVDRPGDARAHADKRLGVGARSTIKRARRWTLDELKRRGGGFPSRGGSRRQGRGRGAAPQQGGRPAQQRQ